MTKFRTDITKGGDKILSIHGPDRFGRYAGVVEYEGEYVLVSWHHSGVPVTKGIAYSLIPLADEPAAPKRDMAMETLEHALKEINQRLDDFDKRLAAEMRRNDELYQDAVARVNGLRNDYLADKDAVSPARVDALDERLDVLEYQELHKRLQALEQRTQPSDTKILEAAQALVDAIASQVNTRLSWKDVNLHLLVPGYLLEGVRPLFNKSTQPSEKGVWVTKIRLGQVMWDHSDVVRKKIAKRLGLEE